MFEVRKLSRRGSMERGEADLGRVLPMNLRIYSRLSTLEARDVSCSYSYSGCKIYRYVILKEPAGSIGTGGITKLIFVSRLFSDVLSPHPHPNKDQATTDSVQCHEP